jgi:hypothetical protein
MDHEAGCLCPQGFEALLSLTVHRHDAKLHTHFWQLRHYNHGPSLVTQIALRGREAQLDR